MDQLEPKVQRTYAIVEIFGHGTRLHSYNRLRFASALLQREYGVM
jgi:hypothetical protein